jgi:hypothetical protein
MQLRGLRGVSPMGFAMAWNGLSENQRQILAELTAFLRSFCEAIGRSQFVDKVVNSLGLPVHLLETAAE